MSATLPKRGKQNHELGLDLDEAQFLNEMLGDSLADDSGGASPQTQRVPEPGGDTDQQGASSRCSTPAAGTDLDGDGELETDPVALIQPFHAKLRQHYKKPPAPVSLRAHSVPCGAMAHVPDAVSPILKSPLNQQSSSYSHHTYAATSASTSPSIPHQQSTQSSHARKVSRGSENVVITAISAVELLQADSVVPPSMRAAMNLYLAPPPAYMHLSPSRLHTASLTRIFHEASSSSGLFDYPSTISLTQQDSCSPSNMTGRKLSPTSADTSCSILITARLADSLRELEAEFSASIRQDGSAHPNSLALARQLCFQYNSTGVKLMEGKQMTAALQLLQKAQLLVEGGGMLDAQATHQSRLQAITLNNMGCYQQRKGKADEALHCFEQTQTLEATLSDADSPARTLLNMCCACSTLGRHQEALEFAQKAIRQALLVFACRHCEIPIPLAKKQNPMEPEDESQPPTPGSPRSRAERSYKVAGKLALQLESVTKDKLNELFDELPWVRELKLFNGVVVITGFYNRGAQQEHLGMLSPAQSSYRTASALACKLFGRGHALSLSSATALESVRQQLLREAGRGCTSRKSKIRATGSRGLASAQ